MSVGKALVKAFSKPKVPTTTTSTQQFLQEADLGRWVPGPDRGHDDGNHEYYGNPDHAPAQYRGGRRDLRDEIRSTLGDVLKEAREDGVQQGRREGFFRGVAEEARNHAASTSKLASEAIAAAKNKGGGGTKYYKGNGWYRWKETRATLIFLGLFLFFIWAVTEGRHMTVIESWQTPNGTIQTIHDGRYR